MQRRTKIWLTVAAVILLAGAVAIDDPLRDFTTNYAEIAEDADDPSLRPLVVRRDEAEVIDAIEAAARRIKTFEYVGEVGDGSATRILLVRTSRIFKFKDDVTLRVETRNGNVVVTGDSQSRVGKGDLGQNPRNLRRILDELRAVLGE